MLGVLLALVLVEEVEDLTDHVAHRIVAGLLRDRHQLDTVLGEFPPVELELVGVPEEAREAVDDHHVKRLTAALGVGYQLLQLRPVLVGSGGAGLHILANDLPAARLAVPGDLGTLVRDGEILFGLSDRRDPQIERCPHP
ncbi:MAG: hypothetical protein WD341_01035 [Tistlia sp.]